MEGSKKKGLGIIGKKKSKAKKTETVEPVEAKNVEISEAGEIEKTETVQDVDNKQVKEEEKGSMSEEMKVDAAPEMTEEKIETEVTKAPASKSVISAPDRQLVNMVNRPKSFTGAKDKLPTYLL